MNTLTWDIEYSITDNIIRHQLVPKYAKFKYASDSSTKIWSIIVPKKSLLPSNSP